MGGMTTIFQQSRPGRHTPTHSRFDSPDAGITDDVPERFRRQSPLRLPEVSELQLVRHATRLSQLNYAVDTHCYPLGSCTMKYNPRISHRLAMESGFLRRHPLAGDDSGQGVLACLYELQEMLCQVTGMSGFSLTPMAGAQGEFAGVAMIRAWHLQRGDTQRREILVPDAAHGTNPATAGMCGFTVREVATTSEGDLDLEALQAALGPQVAGVMLTNPSTLGVFERRIAAVAQMVHAAGALLYYDGANLNAIVGHVRPGDMGVDVMHVNVHKTFATPHGGGGPGAGPVGVAERLLPLLPVPVVVRREGRYVLAGAADRPATIGRLSAFMGNVGVLLRAYVYLRLLGWDGVRRVAEFATLNANYLMVRLRAAGFTVAFPRRRASHEFIVTLQAEARQYGVTALDVAKRLLDHGFYAPTVYFPLLVPECLLIEPTETESVEELDRFVEAMAHIRHEIMTEPDRVRHAPHVMPVQRLDDVRAARQPELVEADFLRGESERP
jgi:glycine dehydrogenase subunit 2